MNAYDEGWAHAARLMHAWRDANSRAAIDSARKE